MSLSQLLQITWSLQFRRGKRKGEWNGRPPLRQCSLQRPAQMRTQSLLQGETSLLLLRWELILNEMSGCLLLHSVWFQFMEAIGKWFSEGHFGDWKVQSGSGRCSLGKCGCARVRTWVCTQAGCGGTVVISSLWVRHKVYPWALLASQPSLMGDTLS